MDKELSILQGCLEELIDAHRNLLAAAEGKRNSIIEGDIEKMEATLACERELLAEVEDAEKRRIAVAARLAAEMEIPEPVKLAAIIEKAPEVAAAKMRKSHEELKSVIDKLRYRTRQNSELLKTSMVHVDEFLRAIVSASATSTGYGADGRCKSGQVSLLDRRA